MHLLEVVSTGQFYATESHIQATPKRRTRLIHLRKFWESFIFVAVMGRDSIFLVNTPIDELGVTEATMGLVSSQLVTSATFTRSWLSKMAAEPPRVFEFSKSGCFTLEGEIA